MAVLSRSHNLCFWAVKGNMINIPGNPNFHHTKWGFRQCSLYRVVNVMQTQQIHIFNGVWSVRICTSVFIFIWFSSLYCKRKYSEGTSTLVKFMPSISIKVYSERKKKNHVRQKFILSFSEDPFFATWYSNNQQDVTNNISTLRS